MKYAFEKAGLSERQNALELEAAKYFNSGGTVDWFRDWADRVITRMLGEGQPSLVQEDQKHAADAQPPMPEGQPSGVRDDHMISADGQPIASGEAKSFMPERAIASSPPAREPKKPNRARGLAQVKAARVEVESLFDYKLFGRSIRDHTRADLVKVHAQAARELKTSLTVAAKDVYHYALVDQMLKHSQGAAGTAQATKMFRPVDLKRFDERAKAMIAEQATAVADIGSTYLMQKTQEILSDARL